ncbi:MAG: PDDEXK nuclease domain-containing protein [Bacteroidales bacterium]|nr:PDDEXK nuclease domain-containing protein [Bacteroidales bacterium]
MENLDDLSSHIFEVHSYFKNYAVKQINNALTLRNWVVGYYLVEYEQSGKDRAEYGKKTLKTLSERLGKTDVKGFSDRNLRLCRQFYLEYPNIWQFIIAKFQDADNQQIAIWQSEIAKSHTANVVLQSEVAIPIATLVDKLNYTHFVELLKISEPVKRTFYEWQIIKNGWNVKQLQRSINSMFYERVGLSKDKETMLSKLKNDSLQQFGDIIKSPYILEFLGIEVKSEFSETDLEQAIIDHLQNFLIELGRGFCFEARQKRITFNNRHYRIDLVFYHRILKCHVLIDLKMGEFDHADAGQMNVYLNYYKENEWNEGDNPPVGIILCSQKDETLVHYATGGLPQEVFVNQYLLQLPSVKELEKLINDEIKQHEI